ncbi:MFS transporter [Marinifilum flexuosum]|uniref:Lysosomal dipeptide transporter MFSD1 n=1 Tax=Marinifilum flexuosum TaxID=1117708 RepID=A0A419X8H5_9BACT|nr:MFS transporter [Marinifilum flexuosum]RKE03946.1 nitrate/nitrite transporter NarK [Marinifilum flexuosum]
MTDAIKKTLRENAGARWFVLILVSVTMLIAYTFMEVLSPLQTQIQSTYGWSGTDWGIVTGAQGYLNVFAFMLIFAGIILDKMGIKFTAVGSGLVMIIGATIKYYAFAHNYEVGATIIGIDARVFTSAAGFAVFCVGAEGAGITVSRIIVKWFKGKEMALAMGTEMALARLGSFLALFGSPRIAKAFDIPTTVLVGTIALSIALILFIVYCVMDVKLDKQIEDEAEEEEPFKIADLGLIIKSKGFWYIAILCLLFYSAVFPFYKFSSGLMVNKFGIDPSTAGDIPSILPFGTILLTPLFGFIYDKLGKGASIMILGAVLLVIVHTIFYLPALTATWVAIAAVILLGIAFSLVPSAMWPSVPKIIPEKQLGSAYALIFYVQNIGLMLVPILLGIVLDKTNPGVNEKIETAIANFRAEGVPANDISAKVQGLREIGEIPMFDYSSTWLIFVGLTILATIFGFLLKAEDKKQGYGLELPNIQK